MHITAIEQEDFDEDNFWDEMEVFCSSLDIKQSAPPLEEYKLQKHEYFQTILVATKEVTHMHEDKVEIVSLSKEEDSS